MTEIRDAGSFVMLWAGENPATHVTLLEKLEASGIPYNDKVLGDDAVAPTADPLPIDWKPRFGFEVAVLSNDYQAAKEILEKVLEFEPANMEIPEQPEVTDPAIIGTAANAAPTTVEVWRGADIKVAEFLTSALSENNISAEVTAAGAATTSIAGSTAGAIAAAATSLASTGTGALSAIYVAPGNEARAREIVREVTEGAPPS